MHKVDTRVKGKEKCIWQNSEEGHDQHKIHKSRNFLFLGQLGTTRNFEWELKQCRLHMKEGDHTILAGANFGVCPLSTSNRSNLFFRLINLKIEFLVPFCLSQEKL